MQESRYNRAVEATQSARLDLRRHKPRWPKSIHEQRSIASEPKAFQISLARLESDC